MRVLITGAGGFVGRSVVAACATVGHEVIAMIRPNAKSDDSAWPENVVFLKADLRQPEHWKDELAGVDAVIHLAAAPSGDLAQQFGGTVIATEQLLTSLPPGVRRFVHVSSFSVYDYRSIPAFAELDENRVIEPLPQQRDAYTWTKIIQERMVVDRCKQHGETTLVVLRPGAVFGPGKSWEFGRAMKLGNFDLIFSPFARMKLTYVDNCADAIVRALQAPLSGEVFNIVDSDLPTHAGFHRMCRRSGAPVGRAIFIPWVMVAMAGLGVRAVNRMFFGGRAKLPEILDYPRQQARWKPLRYNHRRAARELDWTPAVTIKQGIARTFSVASAVEPATPVQEQPRQQRQFES